MTQFMATVGLAIWLYFASFLAVSPIVAADTVSDQNLTMVQQFLVSIPRDYYTVKQIDRVKALTKEKQALLVDVREPKEYTSGHIPGAINLPLRSLTDNLTQIPKDRPVILYCSTGYRTAMGVMALQMLGYDNVRGFPASIEGWKAAGEEIVTKN